MSPLGELAHMNAMKHPAGWMGLLLIGAAMVGGCGYRSTPADLVLHNGLILTLDESGTEAQALAVRNGRVMEAGAERAILNKYSADREVDLRGAVVVPGLMDAHAHFVGYARSLANVDLVGTTSLEEVLGQTRAHAERQPEGWVLGRGWDQNDWEGEAFPERQSGLDALFPDRPVLLSRVDGHAVWANGVALAMAGFTPETKIFGGELLRTAAGELSGVVLDRAADSLQALVPEPDSLQMASLMAEASRRLVAAGLTHITDAGLNPDEVAALEAAQAAGDVPLRFAVMVSDNPEALDHFLPLGPRIDTAAMLDVRAVKFYMDGALGSRGAALLEPYADRTDFKGLFLQDEDQYRAKLERVKLAGFQVATHSIGDAAVRRVQHHYGELLGGVNDLRWRIEHAQVVHKDDVQAFADFTIIPSVQPTHATSDMYWAGQRLGRNRVRRAYIYNRLKQQLGWVPLGTDFPVEGISPLRTFYAAVVRKDAEGYPEGGFQSDEALSREDALRGMTGSAALACFREKELGQIAPGYRADFTVLDRNLLTAPEGALLETRVLQTWIGGEQVFELEGPTSVMHP